MAFLIGLNDPCNCEAPSQAEDETINDQNQGNTRTKIIRGPTIH